MSDQTPERMQIFATATEHGGVKVDFFNGPLLSSVIFSIEDEEPVLAVIRRAFEDARRVSAGESLEDIIESNRKASNAHLTIV